MIILSIVFIIIFQVTVAFAAPAITSLNQSSVIHGGTLVIYDSNNGFGTKNPAAPLMWDDGENETVGTAPNLSTANSFSQVPYAEYKCDSTCYGDAIDEPHRLRYRAVGYTPVAISVGAPHSKSTKFLSGGHEVTATFGGRSVSVTVATPSAYAERWFATWYYRVNPDWPSPCQSGENHKVSVFQAGTSEYNGTDFLYMDLQEKPCDDSGYNTVKMFPVGCTGGSCSDLIDETPPWYYNPSACDADARIGSVLDGWRRYEQRVSNDQGSLFFLVDNEMAWYGTGNPDWVTGGGAYDLGYAGIRSFTVGGYYRYTDDPTNTANDDAFRFFDDIYVDSTLSRVMLANNATYASATILEPQPPTAWAAGEITVKVNQGAIPDGTAYLFVFDADGNTNATGFAVSLSDGAPANAIQGVSIQ